MGWFRTEQLSNHIKLPLLAVTVILCLWHVPTRSVRLKTNGGGTHWRRSWEGPVPGKPRRLCDIPRTCGKSPMLVASILRLFDSDFQKDLNQLFPTHITALTYMSFPVGPRAQMPSYHQTSCHAMRACRATVEAHGSHLMHESPFI